MFDSIHRKRFRFATRALPRAAMVGFLRLYRVLLSPLISPCCRFHPSCSLYGIEAIRTHGCLRGGILLARRLLKCHPFHPGGYDPVPAGAPELVK